MQAEREYELAGLTVHELVLMAVKTINVDQYDQWVWLQKEVDFQEQPYLIGGYVKFDSITRAIEIHGQEALPKQ